MYNHESYTKIHATFWVAGKPFAGRHLHHVPSKGDLVVLKNDRVFRIREVTWDYREETVWDIEVNLSIDPVNPTKEYGND